jgi:quinoprotein glucose dehydrogenase
MPTQPGVAWGGPRSAGRAAARCCGLLAAVALLACAPRAHDPGASGPAAPRRTTDWPSYGNDPGGTRYAVLPTLTRENVGELQVAWTYHTGDVADGSEPGGSTSAFEATPILVDGTLFVCSPFNRVIALDPVTGAERWSYDPQVDLSGRYANQLVCRGVATWLDADAAPGAACRRRIFTATNDARLIALDAASGRPCADFGAAGRVDLNPGPGPQRWRGEYQVTSPPTVIDDLVVVGSAISDNQREDAPSGVVRAFDARSGAPRWAWDTAPPDLPRSAGNTSAAGYLLGTPNAWAPFAVDAERDLVFVPTGNPMLDYFRGDRPRVDAYGSSVVALRGATGEVVWHFQTVHHDLWDYDVPAQPTLTTLRRDGRDVPVVVQATKMGMLFVLDRDTGEPYFPVEERPAPQGGVPGETLSPTQPFPTRPPPLVRHSVSPDDAWGILLFDRWLCRRRIEALRHGDIYQPPSLEGTLVRPGNTGGSNWGGIAVHPGRHIAVANTNDLVFEVQMIPRDQFRRAVREGRHVEMSPQEGAPYGLRRAPFLSVLGIPCTAPPWGRLAAVDLERGEVLWQRPVGSLSDFLPIAIPWEVGTPNLGGPLVTGHGLIFLGATMDDYLHAYDLDDGKLLWRGRLPAGGQATPMAYEAEGRPFVVIAAGGHGRFGTDLGDAIVAFSLPRAAAPEPAPESPKL